MSIRQRRTACHLSAASWRRQAVSEPNATVCLATTRLQFAEHPRSPVLFFFAACHMSTCQLAEAELCQVTRLLGRLPGQTKFHGCC